MKWSSRRDNSRSWRGFGGVTNFNGPGFEAFSWAAGIGASTKYPSVFATSHVPTVHPIMAAKQGAAIDHITGGRFTLNVVTGWHKPEIEMFGIPLLEHDKRYDMAGEWIEIIKRLWTEDDEFDYDGKFYQIKKGYLQPKPIARHPVIMLCRRVEKKGSTSRPNIATLFFWFLTRVISRARKGRLRATANSRAKNTAANCRYGPRPTPSRAKQKRKPGTISIITFTKKAIGWRRPIWSKH